MVSPFNRGLCAGLAALALSAGAALASPSTTTLGTRGTVSQANPAITSNADGAWANYMRPTDYPAAITLPLQWITLKSGKKLAVLVSVPADAKGKAVSGSFPAILTQTAYRIDMGNLIGSILPVDNTLAIGGIDQFMVKRGYVSVAVDALGTGMSDGEWKMLDTDEQEAYGEAVAWVQQQPWCNGSIGVAGTSYLGITSMFTAAQQNPAIKAVFAQVPMGDPYRGIVFSGGLPNAVFIGLWAPLTQQLSVSNGIAVLQHPQYAKQLEGATQQHEADIKDNMLPIVNQALAGTSGYATDDDGFWSSRSPIEGAAKIQVPTFIVGGAHDLFQRDEPLLYEQLKNKVTTKLLIMEGAHVETAAGSVIDADNSSNDGAPSTIVLLLQWFDQYLKGKSTGADKVPNVTQYVNGYGASGGGYRFASTTDWPHPQATAQRYYLHGNMSLSMAQPAAGEKTHTVAEPEAVVVAPSTSDGGKRLNLILPNIHDGSDCSMSYVQWTLGGAALLGKPCYHDDTTVETSGKALEYQTVPMGGDWYINGPIEADVWMSTTATQAALSVRVDDVEPNGTAVPLTNGLQAASFRAVDTTRSRYMNGLMIQPWHPFTAASVQPVVPGQPMLVPVEIFPTAALLRAGHRLRIAISASNQAQGIWTTPDAAAAKGGVTTIYNDPQHPSSVVLPVVPNSALK
ncbi:MAG: CocE/NonD family hydrolase [Nevskia sp.]|nr:CocE/NonD family hydrolase [Nevskia sp.]